MVLSVNKCFVTFHRSVAPLNAEYKIGGNTARHVHRVKDLEVLLDSRLTFNDHRNIMVQTGN